MELADLEARADIARLWGSHRELAADYWGPDKRNGRRSDIADLKTRVHSMEERVTHYFDAEREETCLGIEALKTYKAEIAAKKEEDTDMAQARLSYRGIVVAASLPALISAAVSIALAFLVKR